MARECDPILTILLGTCSSLQRLPVTVTMTPNKAKVKVANGASENEEVDDSPQASRLPPKRFGIFR
jgi:hypothetical protein